MYLKLCVTTMVVLAVSAGCSISTSKVTSERPTPDQSSTTTVVTPTTSTRIAPQPSQSVGDGQPPRSSPCAVAKPKDLTAAGIEGKITLADHTDSFDLGGDGTAPTSCEFMVNDADHGFTNVVVMTDNGGTKQYQDEVSRDTEFPGDFDSTPIEGLGDQAALDTEKPKQDGSTGLHERHVYARKGQSVLGIIVVDDDITNASLEKLATTIVSRLP